MPSLAFNSNAAASPPCRSGAAVTPRPAPSRHIVAVSITKTRSYQRQKDLPRLLPLWPQELADASLPGRLAILAKLRRALRTERQRGIAGHWAYDLARHDALLRAYRHEQCDATALRATEWRSGLRALDQSRG